jgi:hypothetical protein
MALVDTTMVAKNLLCHQIQCKAVKKRRTVAKLKSFRTKTTTTNVERRADSIAQSDCFSKKKVSFASMADVVRVPNITREEFEERWYTTKEYKSFERDRKRTLNAFRVAVDKEIHLDQLRFSSVGLENQLTYHQQCQRRFHIMRHNYYVLKQQHYQKCMGEHDPASLQAISELFSKMSGDIDFLTVTDSTKLTSLEQMMQEIGNIGIPNEK